MRMRMVVVLAALAVGTGCDTALMNWDEPTSAPGDTLGRLTVTPTGSVGFAASEDPPALPVDGARCDTSMVTARDGGRWYAAWFRSRANGSVAVVAAMSTDAGHTWSKASIADSVDIGTAGCARPSPAIAANGGYVHVVYSLDAPEGAGVFFAHSMDSTATFHSAIPVIYGDRLSGAAVAADGMEVAVAYEDPSGSGHRVDVAVSRTQGHTFEPRERGSPDVMSAVRPEVVIRGPVVAISFAEADGGGRVVRVGHLH